MAFTVNVPNVPGVPSVLRALGASTTVSLLVSDAVSLFSGSQFSQQWGIYLGAFPVVVADNVVSFDYRQQWTISDYPVEQGAFESYDKVQTPYNGRFRFTAGGSETNRQLLLDSIAAVAGDLNLYTIITPEAIYTSCNVTHYDYSRSSNNGAGLITVDVWAEEVRQTVTAAMSNTASPSSASQTNVGTVQTTTAPAATTTSTLASSDFHMNN